MIAPIKGFMAKRVIVDITTGLTLGTAVASYFWFGFHKPMVSKREKYYADIAAKKLVEDEA
ncbi:DEKNAAC100578 [Brettanomyces naardenensis]|uniref:Cytochrome c oxidase subunit 9, mitochondrial n=1 Tax=Brettanomyces naardenensis TaxID=13370 RepID=A0A448YG69_BRENA|nr:DEKNAAC100578 [Brettanomyces naardenensis]